MGVTETDGHRYLDSVMDGTDADLVPLMTSFYAPTAITVLDVTYGKGRFWKKSRPQGLITVDLLPGADFQVDNRCMPFPDGMFDVIVYDPPQVNRSVEVGENRKSVMALYNLVSWDGTFVDTLRECYRVASPEATRIVKMADELSRPGPWHHVRLISEAEQVGWQPFDMLVKRRQLSIRNPAQQRHRARKRHCWFIVFKKPALGHSP